MPLYFGSDNSEANAGGIGFVGSYKRRRVKCFVPVATLERLAGYHADLQMPMALRTEIYAVHRKTIHAIASDLYERVLTRGRNVVPATIVLSPNDLS